MRKQFSGINFQFSKILKKNGFTLIELLIVISIIGVLAALLMANFVGIRQRARDAQRKSDVRQIQAALELYRADVGTYPNLVPNCTDSIKSDCVASDAIVYMQDTPSDPLGSTYYNSGSYYYEVGTGNATYVLGGCLENSNDSQAITTSPGGSGCSTGKYYVVTNP